MARIALLSNITIDLLAGMLKKEADVYLSAGFDTWQQDMLIPSSGLYEFNPEAVIVLLHANAYAGVWSKEETGIQTIDEWCGAFKELSKNMPGVPVFVSSIDVSNVMCRYGSEPRYDQRFEDYLNVSVHRLHDSGCNVYILPVKDVISDIGRNAFYSSKMWYAGSMPYSMKGLAALNELICSYVAAIKAPKKKCLAIDLDNTLWGGVIGEDGVDGILLSNNKEGARYKDAQRALKKMREQGVMLAILSKNNVEDVEPVFKHPDMVLQHEDFVAEVVNWEPKSQNIKQLALDLNIGLDAFVFLDDNPAEREQMRAECPEVAVIDFPKDSSLLPATVEKAYRDYFLSLEVTGEDAKKTAMYRSEAQRKVARTTAASVEDYLKNLEMKMSIHLMKEAEQKRVTQLTNKTNQFNLTTKRYSEDEIHAFAVAPDSEIVTVHISDKYGDQGLVSVLILTFEEQLCNIDTFLMSCRVMGRAAEKEILAQIKELLKTRGISQIKGTYVKTAKNAPVQDLYEKSGFKVVAGEIHDVGDKKQYVAEVGDLPNSTGVYEVLAEEMI